MQRVPRLRWELPLVVLAFATLFGVAPAGRVVLAHEADGKPARVQTGTCDSLGGVAFQLVGVGAAVDLGDAEIPEPEIAGAPSAAPVLLSETTVGASVDAIVGGGHAIVVYASDDAMDEVVACGDVGGPMLRDELVVGLREVGGSGFSGIAVLAPDGAGTRVTVYLGEGLGGAAATPNAEAGDHHDEGDDHDAATPAS